MDARAAVSGSDLRWVYTAIGFARLVEIGVVGIREGVGSPATQL
jgi:hypothetical protein